MRHQGVNPLFFSQTENPNLEPSFLDNPILLPIRQSTASPLVKDIAQQPGEVGFAFELHHMFKFIIKVMIAETGQINSEWV